MLAKKVWENLSAIDVNKHCEKKGSLTYLSWAWAWSTLMEYYPEATYSFDAPKFYEDGTCEVWVTVTIAHGDEAMFREMWLPVMDNRNNAVKNPDARQISDTRMRALVKCLAMFGLGHYIYAGEDLPTGGPIYTAEQKKAFLNLLDTSALGFYLFRLRVGDEIYTDLYNHWDKDKMKHKSLCDDQERQGAEVWQALLDTLSGDDNAAILELLEDETQTVIALAKSQLNVAQRRRLDEVMKEAA